VQDCKKEIDKKRRKWDTKDVDKIYEDWRRKDHEILAKKEPTLRGFAQHAAHVNLLV
jgi:hypothetical protein